MVIEWIDDQGVKRSVEDTTGNYPHRCVRVLGESGLDLNTCIVPNMDLKVWNKGAKRDYLDLSIVEGNSFRNKTSPSGSSLGWKDVVNMHVPTADIKLVKFQKNLLDIGRPLDFGYRNYPDELNEKYAPATIHVLDQGEIERARGKDKNAFSRNLSGMIYGFGNGFDEMFEEYKEKMQSLGNET